MSLNRQAQAQRVILHRSMGLALAAGILAGTLSSCGPDPLTGRVNLSGSSTLSPLALKTADRWKAKHPSVDVNVEAIGSDAGLERLVRYRDADFALMSRPLDLKDNQNAEAAGVSLIALPVAWDAVCLVVPQGNTWVTSLTRAQAARAFTTADKWSDLDPSWPAKPIHRFLLGPNSGTADVFATALFPQNRTAFRSAPGAQTSEDDHILARGVAGVDGSLGFLGWTTVQEVAPTLRAVALDGVTPSPQTIRDRTYGLPRQLWLVTTRDVLKHNAAARSLVRFLYDEYPSLAAATGLVGLTDAERRSAELTLNESGLN
jgi:phosphate transport system substrate-binding protein